VRTLALRIDDEFVAGRKQSRSERLVDSLHFLGLLCATFATLAALMPYPVASVLSPPT
jgi:hypothetical protein